MGQTQPMLLPDHATQNNEVLHTERRVWVKEGRCSGQPTHDMTNTQQESDAAHAMEKTKNGAALASSRSAEAPGPLEWRGAMRTSPDAREEVCLDEGRGAPRVNPPFQGQLLGRM